MTYEECVKCYWQGYDTFNGSALPVCPYESQSQASVQWWCGYNDAETVKSGAQDYKEYDHDYTKDYSK